MNNSDLYVRGGREELGTLLQDNCPTHQLLFQGRLRLV